MTNRPEPFDPQDDAQDDAELERLLKSVYADTPPAEEFQKSLLGQLDQEFVRTFPNDLSERTKKNASQGPRHRSRISLRMAISMTTAASLLFVVALWNNQSAYGWASMLRALEQCNWVQAASETAGIRGWVSSQRGIVAIRSGGEVAFHDHGERISSQYLADRQVVYRQALPAGGASLGPEELFGLLLGNELGSGFRVSSESWRRVESSADHEETIELRVTLGVEGKLQSLLLRLDPETHLPRSCRLLASGQQAARVLEFAYPAEGPSSIFSMGIPRETKVVASLEPFRQKLEQAKEQEPSRRVFNFGEQKSQLPLAKETIASKQGTVEAAAGATTAGTPTVESSETEVAQEKSERIASNLLGPQHELPAVILPEQTLAQEKLVEQINTQLTASWRSQGITPAEPASDSEFLRRVYLDLTGRIPMVSEVYGFLEDLPQDRRERLVDQLLASRDHATHLATVWRTLLLPDGVDTNGYGGTAKFDQWLADRFEQNLPYDQLVRQLLLAEGRVSDSGPILFYAALKLNPEELAAKTSRTFLGMRMECAQCHDHKFDDSITQEDFWGFAAHFAQISRPQGKMDMTSSVLRVRDNSRGEVMLPDTEEVISPRMPYVVNLPNRTEEKRSRREELVDWLTTKQNSRFARATVNRAWQHLFGLGLVEPVDDMRSDNPATCPEVLETLSLDFAASGYDLRRLLRTLVLSDAYQLSSRAATDEPSQSLVFARMNIKSFTADQLYDCISVAAQFESAGVDQRIGEGLVRFGNQSRQAFIEQFRAPPGQRTDYHAGIPQALTLMHGYLVNGGTDLASSGRLKSLNAPFFTDEERVKTLFLATLSRSPDQEEQVVMLAHVEAATNDEERSRALGDILWALLNCAEFTFIH